MKITSRCFGNRASKVNQTQVALALGVKLVDTASQNSAAKIYFAGISVAKQ